MEIKAQNFKLEVFLGSPDEEGWMNASLDIDSGCFSGAFLCNIERLEWQQFISILKDLYDSAGVKKELSWQAMEMGLDFQFQLRETGSFTAYYRLAADPAIGPFLSGEFEADQSYIPGWLQSA
ncbi:MAG: hypothetical protein V7688_08260 [Alcanivorax jadensis]|uniref:WapI family immunity protein n=1 Tax=Alcanivorax jadensis TaxID=64988 RepID=UPI003001F33B